jgi:hypothetical protein
LAISDEFYSLIIKMIAKLNDRLTCDGISHSHLLITYELALLDHPTIKKFRAINFDLRKKKHIAAALSSDLRMKKPKYQIETRCVSLVWSECLFVLIFL